jgi:hypothetical protein
MQIRALSLFLFAAISGGVAGKETVDVKAMENTSQKVSTEMPELHSLGQCFSV